MVESAAPSPEAEARTAAIRDFFVQLKKGAKAMALYQHQSARFGEFLKPALTALSSLLESGPLTVKVTAEAFLVADEPVLEEGVPGRFFREGVRQIHLRPGLADVEFVQLAAIMFSPERSGDSLVAALREANLQNVEYVVVEGFTVGELSEQETQVEVDQIVDLLYARLRSKGEDTVSFARVSAADLELKLENVDVVRGLVSDGQGVSDAFRTRVQDELRKDAMVRSHQQLVELLLAGLRDGRFPEVKPVVEILTQLVDGLLLQEDYKPVAHLLSELAALVAAGGGDSSPAADVRRAVVFELGAVARVSRFAEVLKTNADVDHSGIAACLAVLDPAALGPMADALDTLEQPDHRAVFVEALVAVGRERPEFFFQRLKSERPVTVRNTVAVIEQAGFPDAAKHVGALLKSPNAQVRAEVVALLGNAKDPGAAHALLLTATVDKVPQVRAEAFRAMVRVVPRRAAADLMRLPKLPDWDKRPDDEKALIFECMGRTEHPDVLPYLSQLLGQKKGLFGGHKVLEIKLLAVAALSVMQNLQAAKMLQSIYEAPKLHEPEVVAAARKALLQMRRLVTERARGAPGEPAGPEDDEQGVKK